MKIIKTIVITVFCFILICGCAVNKGENERNGEMGYSGDNSNVADTGHEDTATKTAGLYREKYIRIRENALSANSITENTISAAEPYKKDYWLLAHDFVNGGFSLGDGPVYTSSDFNKEDFQFSLSDLNDDGIPEFLLGYGYGEDAPYSWTIFSLGDSYNECKIGDIRFYDRKEGVCITGNPPFDATGYVFDGHQLKQVFEYYESYEEIYDTTVSAGEVSEPIDFIDHFYYDTPETEYKELTEGEYKKALLPYSYKDVEIKGQLLTMTNLAEALQIPLDSWKKESACRSYLASLKNLLSRKNELEDMRFSLIDIDGDDIPEMFARGDVDNYLFYYREGNASFEQLYFPWSGDGEDRIDGRYFFPGKNMIRISSSSWGHSTDEYYTLFKNGIRKVLSLRKEPLTSLTFANSHQKDILGNTLYDYYLDENIVSEKEAAAVLDSLKDVFGLEEENSFEDIENYSLTDMIPILEKEAGD